MYTWASLLLLLFVGDSLTDTSFYQFILNDESRIVGGRPTNIEQHPFQVSLQLRNRHVCGGAIISAEWVVTAAHCVQSTFTRFVSIKAGVSDITRLGTVIRAKEIIIHERYNQWDSDYDIALIRTWYPCKDCRADAGGTVVSKVIVSPTRAEQKDLDKLVWQELEKPLLFNRRIQPISMAPVADVYKPGTTATVTGWGVLRSNGALTNLLRKVDIPLVSNVECSRLYIGRAITARMICAGYVNFGGKDACQGDSGGPLVQYGRLIGIVSWGFGCAEPSFPGVYTRVTALRSWITEKAGL